MTVAFEKNKTHSINFNISRYIYEDVARLAIKSHSQISEVLRTLIVAVVYKHPTIQENLDKIVKLGGREKTFEPTVLSVTLDDDTKEKIGKIVEGIEHPYDKKHRVSIKNLMVGLSIWLIKNEKSLIKYGLLSLPC